MDDGILIVRVLHESVEIDRLLCPHGNAITDRAPQYLLHGVLIRIIQIQVTVFFITLEDVLALQKAGNPVADRMHQLYQFLLFLPIGALETCSTVFGFRVNPIQEQHMEMYIEIERTAEPLDQRHRTGLRGLSGESRLLNQMALKSPCIDTM